MTKMSRHHIQQSLKGTATNTENLAIRQKTVAQTKTKIIIKTRRKSSLGNVFTVEKWVTKKQTVSSRMVNQRTKRTPQRLKTAMLTSC